MKRNDQALYQDYAENWWEHPKRFQRLLINQVAPRLACFERVTPGWQDVDVLDLGCGGGYMAEALAQRGARVIGVDPSLASLSAAREHARQAGLAIDYREGVGEALPLPDGSLDRVVCVDVLEHVQDLERVLREVRRVLRLGGIFFFGTINRNWLASLISVTAAEFVLRIVPPGSHDPAMFISPADLRKKLAAAQFITKPEWFTGLVPVGLNRRLDFVFGLFPLTWIWYLGYATAG